MSQSFGFKYRRRIGFMERKVDEWLWHSEKNSRIINGFNLKLIQLNEVDWVWWDDNPGKIYTDIFWAAVLVCGRNINDRQSQEMPYWFEINLIKNNDNQIKN